MRVYGSFRHNGTAQRLVILVFLVNSNIQTNHGHAPAIPGYFYEELSLSWDDLELQFLSNVNGPTLHSNGYHVINATFPVRRSSYMIHISKTQGLFHPEQLGVSTEDANNFDCLYSGTVMGIGNGLQSESGIVSLSTCHHEFGFEGLILLPHEQYYVKPSLNAHHQRYPHHHRTLSKRSTASNLKPTVPHKAFKVNSPSSPFKQSVDEVHRVPPEELLNAIEKQSKTNLDLLEDEDDGISHETDANSLEVPLIEDVGDDDCGAGDSNCKHALPPVMLTLSNRKSIKEKSNKPKKKPSKTATSTANTGTTTKVQVVEIAVFTDERLYKRWQSLYPKDTLAKMNQYVLAVINNMNALYKQPSFTDQLKFRLVHLEIETAKPKSLKDHKGHATKYLKSFCNYAAEKNQYGSLWDHALLLTGYDIQEDGSNATAGIAWFSTMCINGLSCSLIEGYTFGSTFITTHEIGHSLGMEHDGTGPNIGCDPNSHIMSPTTGGGKTDWSKCSMKNMKEFVSKGYMGNPAPKCITKKGSKAGSPIKFTSNKLPGEQFSAEEQCTAECQGCTPYITTAPPYNDMCHVLHCAQKQANYALVRSTHPALEGTTCGTGRTCRHGKCK